jgi:hypothetical protein
VPVPRTVARTGQRLIFLGTLVLFTGWLGWLAYLAVTARTTVVLSRPQFLVATLNVVVTLDEIENAGRPLTVKQVLWSATDEGRQLVNATITVSNLDRTLGWDGPGDYLLPLVPNGAPGRYQVPTTPRSPGYEPNPRSEFGKPHIYPVTPATLRQVEQLPRP